MESGTKADIIDATYRALCEHGYAGLTTQRIATASSMTTATIHYHFDTKEELLQAFLDDLVERFEAKFACDATDPRERLIAFLDAVFVPSAPDGEFPVAIMELIAQAPYRRPFRERFLDLDDVMCEVLANIIADGIDAGYFDQTDPTDVARLVTTLINGAHARTVALGESAEETRWILEQTLELHLGWSPDRQ